MDCKSKVLNLEKLEKKLEENWNDRTTATLKAADKARNYLLKKGFAPCAYAINKAEEIEENQEDKISSRNLSKAKLYTAGCFLHDFEQRWGVKSPAVGILFSSDAWKKIGKKLFFEKGISGYFFPESYFKNYKNKNFPLNKTGLILTMQDEEIPDWGLGHEALHAAHSLYSKSWREVNKKYEKLEKEKGKKDFYPLLRVDMEMNSIDELAALRDNIGKKEKYDWRWVQNLLAGKYLKRYLNAVKDETKVDLRKESVYFKKKLPKVISAAKYLQKKLGDRALTRILFTAGPTVEEIRKKQYSSPFDDILGWKDLVKRNKINKDYLNCFDYP